MRAALALAAALLFVAAAPAPAADAASGRPPDKALNALFEREFANGLEESPERATYIGVEGHDHRLTDLSPQAVARRKARVKRVIAELARFDPARLSTQDRISREVMLANLRLADEEQALYGELPFGAADSWMRVSSMNGPHLMLPVLVQATRFRRTADYENYLKRLQALPHALEQEIAMLRVGMRTGWLPPRAAMQKVPGMFTVFAAADVTATPMWRPFAEFPREVGDDDRKRLTDAGRGPSGLRAHEGLPRGRIPARLPRAARRLDAARGSRLLRPPGARADHDLAHR